MEFPFTLEQLVMSQQQQADVSILVLMEFPFTQEGERGQREEIRVSILVLIEFPFTHSSVEAWDNSSVSFNPCFNGISFHALMEFPFTLKVIRKRKWYI